MLHILIPQDKQSLTDFNTRQVLFPAIFIRPKLGFFTACADTGFSGKHTNTPSFACEK